MDFIDRPPTNANGLTSEQPKHTAAQAKKFQQNLYISGGEGRSQISTQRLWNRVEKLDSLKLHRIDNIDTFDKCYPKFLVIILFLKSFFV